MVVLVTASNVLVLVQINDWLTWAAFTYPVTFFITDLTNRRLGSASARRVVYVGFAAGVVLSAILASPRVAAASGAAFLVAQLLDVVVFDRLRDRVWWMPPLVSSLLASVVDTVLFFSLAFAGTGAPWPSLAAGDFAVKVVMALLLLAPFHGLLRLTAPRAPAAS
jgi:hypothetical protein